VAVAAGDTVGVLLVINGDADVAGVADNVIVVNGTARVTGQVRSTVAVARGHLDVRPGGAIADEIMLYGSTMAADPAARIPAVVHDEPGFSFSARASWFVWLGVTIIFVIGALLFAGLASRQLVESMATMVREPRATTAGALIVMIGLPAAAMAAFATIIGIPLGLVILFMLLPATAFLGFIVTGTVVGAGLVRRDRTAVGARPFAEAVTGVFVLQLLSVIPAVGGLIAMLASLAGAGALAVRAWRLLRRRPAALEEQVEMELAGTSA